MEGKALKENINSAQAGCKLRETTEKLQVTDCSPPYRSCRRVIFMFSSRGISLTWESRESAQLLEIIFLARIKSTRFRTPCSTSKLHFYFLSMSRLSASFIASTIRRQTESYSTSVKIRQTSAPNWPQLQYCEKVADFHVSCIKVQSGALQIKAQYDLIRPNLVSNIKSEHFLSGSGHWVTFLSIK